MDLSRLAAAIATALSPTATSEERRAAEATCEQAKSMDNAVAAAIAIFPLTPSPSVRHFALHAIEHVIKTRLDSLAADERAGLAGFLNADLPLLLACDGSAVREKAAQVVVLLALHVWPQYCPALVDEWLLRLPGWREDASRAHLSLLCLHALAEQIREGVDVRLADGVRRGELQTALSAVSMGIVESLCLFVDAQLGARDARLLPRTLSCLSVYVSWSSLPVGRLRTTLAGLFRCCASDEPPVAAGLVGPFLALLAAHSERPIAPADVEVVERVLDEMEATRRIAARALQSSDADDFRLAAQLAANYGVHAICSRTRPVIRPSLPAYLDLALDFLAHDSLVAASSILAFWWAAVRHEVVAEHPALVAAIPRLILCAMAGLARDERPAFQLGPNSVDFVDFAEFRDWDRAARSRLLDLLRVVAERQPALSIAVWMHHWSLFWSSQGENAVAPKAPKPCLLQLAAFVDTMDAMLRGLGSRCLRAPPESVSRLAGLLAGFIREHPADDRVRAKWISALKSLGCALAGHVPLADLLNRLFGYIGGTDAATGHSEPVRTLACSALSHLATACPEALLAHHGPLCSAVLSHLSALGSSRTRERILFSELLLSLASQSDDLQTALALLSVATSQLELFTTPLASTPLVPATLLAALQLRAPATEEEGGRADGLRSTAAQCMTFAHSYFRRLAAMLARMPGAAAAVRPAFGRVLDPVLSFIACVHECSEPSKWDVAAVDVRRTSAFFALELGRVADPAADEGSGPALRWLTHGLFNAYSAVGCAALCGPLLFEHPAFPGRLLAGFERFTLRQWAYLVNHVVGSICVHAPLEAYETLTRPVLSLVLGHLAARVEEEARGLEESRPSSQADLGREIERQSALTAAVAGMASLLSALMPVPSPSDSGYRVSPLSRTILFDDQLRVVVVVSRLVRMSTATATHKMVLLVAGWLPVIGDEARLAGPLYQVLSEALLLSIAGETSADLQGTVVQLLAELYRRDWAAGRELVSCALQQHVPGLGPADIARLNAKMCGGVSNKARRTALKQLLDPLLTASAARRGAPASSSLHRLPDRLVVLRGLQQEPPEGDPDLSALLAALDGQ